MRIENVRVTLLRTPFTEPPKWGFEFNRPRELVVVEIDCAGGITGMGYLMPLGGGMQTIKACLEELMIPRLIGRDATEIEAIWKDLWQATYWLGRGGVTVFALSAIDIALWDALGKRAGLPLFRLWGAHDANVPCYGSGCWRGLGSDGMIEKAKRYVAAGFDAIKMQVGHLYDDATDIRHVAEMRAALGPDVRILIDVNMGWTADQAIHVGRQIEEFDVYWLEEPVPAEDFKSYMRVADQLSIRIVGGESHFTRYDLRPFFEHPKIPILQPDPMRGGLTEMRKIATLADTWGLRIAPHLFPELMVHLMAAIPNGELLEYVDFLDDLWEVPVLPENAIARPPERPGHGLAFREEVLRDCVVTV